MAFKRSGVRLPYAPPEKDANLDTKVSVFSCLEKPCTTGLFSFCWVHGRSFPSILWVQNAPYVGFPLFHPYGWVHDKTADGCEDGSRLILGAHEVLKEFRSSCCILSFHFFVFKMYCSPANMDSPICFFDGKDGGSMLYLF